jgi:hypothetical protein
MHWLYHYNIEMVSLEKIVCFLTVLHLKVVLFYYTWITISLVCG